MKPASNDTDDLREFIRRLPKTETHLHLEGALPFSLLADAYPDKYTTPPASWADGFKFRDFGHFERELLDRLFDWFRTPERYHTAAKAVFQEQLEQNVRYAEISFASGVVEFAGIPGDEILQAIHAAVPAGLEVRVFMGIHRNGCGHAMKPVFEQALDWSLLTGFDLHGPEHLPLEPWTAELWAASRTAGKFNKAHAGEFMPAGEVRAIVESLQVTRIQHGVRATEDPEVIQLLKARTVTLDVCPISNVKLMPGVTAANHPARALLDAGIPFTLSTDDPLMFGNRLEDEYLLLARFQGCGPEELVRIAQTGFEAALTDDAQRADWLAELAAVGRS